MHQLVKDTEMLSKEMLCDKHNIQEMINMLKNAESKGEYRSIAACIKKFVKYVDEEKDQLTDKVWREKERNDPKLFEVEPTEIDHKEHLLSINSYFGVLD